MTTIIDNQPLVLLIDSDDAIRHLFGREIARSFRLLSSATDEQALELCREQAITTIIIALRPPFSKSIELLKHLKKTFDPQKVPIIAYSPVAAQEMEGTIPTPYYLPQPIKPSQLLDFLNRVLIEDGIIQ